MPSSGQKRKADATECPISLDRARLHTARLLRYNLDKALAVAAEHELFASETFSEHALACLTNGPTNDAAIDRCLAAGMIITPKTAHSTLQHKLAAWKRYPSERLSLNRVSMLLTYCEPEAVCNTWGVNLLAQAYRSGVTDPALIAMLSAHNGGKSVWLSAQALLNDFNDLLVGKRIFIGNQEVSDSLLKASYLGFSPEILPKLPFLFRHMAVRGHGIRWLQSWFLAGVVTTPMLGWLADSAVAELGREVFDDAALARVDQLLLGYPEPMKDYSFACIVQLRDNIRRLLDTPEPAND